MKEDKDNVSKSWFCVFNNPVEHGYNGTPQEIVDKIIETWIVDNPQRTCAANYCISADGLNHCHAVLEDTKAMRFSAIKKVFPSMHIAPTKGSKEQAEDYINKRGHWEEKGKIIIYTNRHGEIKGCQGQRNDLEIIEEMLAQGKSPNEIMELSLAYRRYDKIIKDAYYHKRAKETPMKRDVLVFWHFGASGSGKSHMVIELAKEYGENEIYFISDYKNGFDKYNGEKILFMDEFRGQLPYALFLTILEGYKAQIPCRFTNVLSLWSEIHICSVLPPEEVYKNMVNESRNLDTIEQLKRRINTVVYHYKQDNEYFKYDKPMNQYKGYKSMIKDADFAQSLSSAKHLVL